MNSPIRRLGLTQGTFSSLSVVVTSLGILSLFLGFGRELFIVWQYGIGRVTDAYFIAAFTPQIVYQLVIAGPMLAALVPELNRVAAEQGSVAMRVLAQTLLGRVAVALVACSAILMIGSPVVAHLSAPGYDADRLHLASQLLAILAPQIASFGVGSVLVAVLYARGRVLPSALAQVFNNALALTLIALLYHPLGIWGVALAVSLASAGYVGWLLVAVARSGSTIWPRIRSDSDNSLFVVTVLLPLVGIALLSQLSGFWERLFASTLPVGQLSGISYGYRILFVAQAASAAVGTVTLASLSASAAHQESSLFKRQTGWAIEINLALSITAAAVLIAQPRTIADVLYGSAHLSNSSASLVADIVRIAAVALPAIATQVVCAQTLYAKRHIRPLAVMALLQLAIQLPLSPLLILSFGYKGFAVANATAQVAVAIAFYSYLWKRGMAPAPAELLITLGRDIAAAAVGVGVVAWLWPEAVVGERLTAFIGLAAHVMISVSAICIVLVVLGDPLLRLPLRFIGAQVARTGLK